jgi:hypothetical protein
MAKILFLSNRYPSGLIMELIIMQELPGPIQVTEKFSWGG